MLCASWIEISLKPTSRDGPTRFPVLWSQASTPGTLTGGTVKHLQVEQTPGLTPHFPTATAKVVNRRRGHSQPLHADPDSAGTIMCLLISVAEVVMSKVQLFDGLL